MSKNKQLKPPLTIASGSDRIKERLQVLLHSLIKAKHVHHAVIAVENADGSFRWIGTEGDANPDGTPMEADTPFWIASVTKLYIAATILKLYEQERISIDDTIATYLPQRMIKGLHRMSDGVDYSDKITIRHLLGHTSGLPEYLEIHAKGEKSLVDQVLEDGDRAWTIEDSIQIVRTVNAPLFAPQPLGAKRQNARYSDTNYQLLIAIIEVVTGQPLHTAFEEMLYKPLNLKETFHPGTSPPKAVPPVATVWYQDRPLNIPEAMRSFGDLNSTATDLLTFMRALISGAVFDHAATLDLMKGNWNQFGFSLSPIGPGWPIEYGLGMMRFRIPRILAPFRPIPEVIGHTGASGSWLFYSPPLEVFIAGDVSQITAAAVPFKLVPKVLRIFNGH